MTIPGRQLPGCPPARSTPSCAGWSLTIRDEQPDLDEWSDDPRHILELLQKVVTVSMRTVEIVSTLPELDISE